MTSFSRPKRDMGRPRAKDSLSVLKGQAIFGMRLPHFFGVFAVVLAVSGCDSDRAVVWQANVASPDGNYRVHAETVQQSGPGNAWVSTQVTLGQGGPDRAFEILSLSHDIVPPPGIDPVSIHWTGPRTLRLEYLPSSNVDFEAIKGAGVEIESVPRPR